MKSLTVQECAGCSASDPVTEPYGAATVTSDASGTLIGAPGGLFYRSTLDPAKTYTVSIPARNVAKTFKMQTR